MAINSKQTITVSQLASAKTILQTIFLAIKTKHS